jgi:hypothetical protein
MTATDNSSVPEKENAFELFFRPDETLRFDLPRNLLV